MLLALASYLALYAYRWRRSRREAGRRSASVWRLLSFAAGVLMLVIALVSPVDGLGEQLFVMHMVQHVFLTDLAAVLLLLGLTKVILRPLTALVQRVERRAGVLAHPVAAVLIYGGTLWVWHIPAMYQAGLEQPVVHTVQHLSFACAALLFWWHVLSPIRSRHRLTGMGVVFYVGAMKLLTGLLASLFTWAPVHLYEWYARQPRYWGLSAEDDQALAGAVMMVEASLVMTLAAIFLFVRMLTESEETDLRAERFAVSGSVTRPAPGGSGPTSNGGEHLAPHGALARRPTPGDDDSPLAAD